MADLQGLCAPGSLLDSRTRGLANPRTRELAHTDNTIHTSHWTLDPLRRCRSPGNPESGIRSSKFGTSQN